MVLQPGSIILKNKYRVDAYLGQGASAEVYRATHLTLKSARALKVLRKDALPASLGSTDFGDYRQRFQLEAQLGAKMNNPNLLQVYDFEQEGDLLVLTMEYAAGGSLAERLARLRERKVFMPIDEVVGIGFDIMNGLAAIHAEDAVHRDLKPSNILLDSNGHAKVADLGLAQIHGGPSMRSRLSTAMPHPGTPAYMSPEQASTTAYLTSASDVYALGLIMFEMLTGRAYKNVKPGTQASNLRQDTPATLNDWVLHMLANDANDRPFDCAELSEALRVSGIVPRWNPDYEGRSLREATEAAALREVETVRKASESQTQKERDKRAAQEAAEQKALEAQKLREATAQIEAKELAKLEAQRQVQELTAQKAEKAEKQRTQAGVPDTKPKRGWAKTVVGGVVIIIAAIGIWQILPKSSPSVPQPAAPPAAAFATAFISAASPEIPPTDEPLLPTSLVPPEVPTKGIPIATPFISTGNEQALQPLPQNNSCPFQANAGWLNTPNFWYGPFFFNGVNYTIMYNATSINVWDSSTNLVHSNPDPILSGRRNQWLRFSYTDMPLSTPFVICVDMNGAVYALFEP